MIQVAFALFLLVACQAAPPVHHVDTSHHVSAVHHIGAPVVPVVGGHHVLNTHHSGTVISHPAPVRYSTADHAHVAVVDEAPKPYAYGYDSPADGGSSSKEENSDGAGRVTGSYTVTDEDGRFRKVEYYADETGFHANVQTNEPGTANQNPADVVMESTAVNEPVDPVPVVAHRHVEPAPVHYVQPVHATAHRHQALVHAPPSHLHYRRVPVHVPAPVHHGGAVVIAAQPHLVGAHHGHSLAHHGHSLGHYGHSLGHHGHALGHPVVGGHHLSGLANHHYPLHRQLVPVPVVAHH